MSLRKKTWISCINGVRIFNINHYTFSHLKRPFYRAKKIRKKRKINSRNFTYDGLTFSCSSFLLEQVKEHVILVIFQKDYLSCIWKQNINKLWFIRWVDVLNEKRCKSGSINACAPRRGTGCTAPSSWPRGFSARAQCNSGCRRPFAAASGAPLALIPRRSARTRPSACAR
jgi:hypothetical protein